LSPSLSTSPANSKPGMFDGQSAGAGYRPIRCSMSAWLRATAFTFTLTSPRWGSGSGTSFNWRTSGPPGLVITTAFIWCLCVLSKPYSRAQRHYLAFVSPSRTALIDELLPELCALFPRTSRVATDQGDLRTGCFCPRVTRSIPYRGDHINILLKLLDGLFAKRTFHPSFFNSQLDSLQRHFFLLARELFCLFMAFYAILHLRQSYLKNKLRLTDSILRCILKIKSIYTQAR